MAESGIIELQRRCHEMRERLMTAMVDESLAVKKTTREQINSDWRMSQLLNRYTENGKELEKFYEDKDGLRKDEMAALTGPNEFGEFYNRLNSVKEFHRNHPKEICIPMSLEFDELAKSRENPSEEEQVLVNFTDEEGYGKYLDLHECYNMFINLKGIEKVDYLTYLSEFDCLYKIPKEKKSSKYVDYLTKLYAYLEDYLCRVNAMYDMVEELELISENFEQQWSEGTFKGWPKETSGALAHKGAVLDLLSFSSWEELASLGLDRLKSALIALGMKCGGTLEERAKRLFSCRGKEPEGIDPSLLSSSKSNGSNKAKNSETSKNTAFMEAKIYRLSELLEKQRADTKDNIQIKQARATGEGENSDEENVDVESDDDDPNEVVYNPKNVPLGWDGKPIPYWLYKLHGLNISYTCEICGNHSYRGPKEYQRHFSEWRHAHGMRCLGIPNTAHFANVTSIEDAVDLWQKIRSSKETKRWNAEADEEFEDSSGNVVSRKTFEDLKRQGLL